MDYLSFDPGSSISSFLLFLYTLQPRELDHPCFSVTLGIILEGLLSQDSLIHYKHMFQPIQNLVQCLLDAAIYTCTLHSFLYLVTYSPQKQGV